MVSIIPESTQLGLVLSVTSTSVTVTCAGSSQDPTLESGPWIDQLILHNHVLSGIVLEILHIQNLGIGVIIYSRYGGIARIGNIYYVHLRPPGYVCVCPAIGRISHLDLCITRGSQRIVTDWNYVLRVQDMLARVPVVMIVRLDQGIDQGIRTNGSIQFVIEQQKDVEIATTIQASKPPATNALSRLMSLGRSRSC